MVSRVFAALQVAASPLLALVLIGVLTLSVTMRHWRGLPILQTAVPITFLCLLLNAHILPAVATLLSPQSFPASVREVVPREARLLAFGEQAFATSFYAKRLIEQVDDDDDVITLSDYVVLPQARRESLAARLAPDQTLRTVVVQKEPVLQEASRLILVQVIGREGE